MFFRQKSNIINTQVLKVKTDKIAKRILRDAKKRIRRGELADAHSLSMYLSAIDARYDHIEADVKNATMIVSYDVIRAAKIAEIRKTIGFYDNDFVELKNLYRNLMEKAKETGRSDDGRQDVAPPPDMKSLRATFEKLAGDTAPGIDVATRTTVVRREK